MVRARSTIAWAASFTLLCIGALLAQGQVLQPGGGAAQGLPDPDGTGPLPTTTTVSPSNTLPTATTTSGITIATQIPGPANNTFEPGTVNCFDPPYCKDNEECYVLSDGLVCLPREFNYGYILARNESGVPSVPRWSGPKSTFNQTCTFMRMPNASEPRLSQIVYSQIIQTIPKNLVLSHLDLDTSNWYTLFSNCEVEYSCYLGTCQPRPKVDEPCTSSWQCNRHALGLNDNNAAASTAENNLNGTTRGSLRCEYQMGEKSENRTCQYLVQKEEHPDTAAGSNLDRPQSDSRTRFSAWHILLPVALLLLLVYGATVVYQRRIRKNKMSKRRQAQYHRMRDEYVMEAYDDIH